MAYRGVYASSTSVSPERSQAEIAELLRRYGATKYMSGWDTANRRHVIQFEAAGRRIRFDLQLPNPDDPKFKPSRPQRRWVNGHWEAEGGAQLQKAFEQEVRRLWRALALVIKAKLEAVASGITTFENEFLAHVVMPDGKTLSQHIAPRLEAIYTSGRMQPLLPERT